MDFFSTEDFHSPTTHASVAKPAMGFSYTPPSQLAEDEGEDDSAVEKNMAKLAFPQGTGPTNCTTVTFFCLAMHKVLMLAATSCAIARILPHTKKDQNYKMPYIHGLGMGVDYPIFAQMVTFIATSYNRNVKERTEYNWTPEKEKKLRDHAVGRYMAYTGTYDWFFQNVKSSPFHWAGMQSAIQPQIIKEATLFAIRMAVNCLSDHCRKSDCLLSEMTENDTALKTYCRRWYSPLFQHATVKKPFTSESFYNAIRYLLVDMRILSSYNCFSYQNLGHPRYNPDPEPDLPESVQNLALAVFPVGTAPMFKETLLLNEDQQHVLFYAVASCSLEALKVYQMFPNHLGGDGWAGQDALDDVVDKFWGYGTGISREFFLKMVDYILHCRDPETGKFARLDRTDFPSLMHHAFNTDYFPPTHLRLCSWFRNQLSTLEYLNEETLLELVPAWDQFIEASLYAMRMSVNLLPLYAHLRYPKEFKKNAVQYDAHFLYLYFGTWNTRFFRTLKGEGRFQYTKENLQLAMMHLVKKMYIPHHRETSISVAAGVETP